MRPTIRCRSWLSTLRAFMGHLLLIGPCIAVTAVAQDTPKSDVQSALSRLANTDEFDEDDSADAFSLVLKQISRLNDSSYRVRMTARSVIEQHPNAALEVISEEIHRVDSIVGIQLVDMLSGLALHSDLTISSKAIHLLNSLANEATSIGRGASNSLKAIADLQEEKAIEVLTHYGASIGPQDFSLNGRLEMYPSRLGLVINDNFSGSDSEVERIRFLKSVEVIYLRGKKVSAAAIEAVSSLKQIKAIRLHGLELKPEQLLLFKDLRVLEHLGLSYIPMDDSCVPIITQLPITESIRLYGTKVTTAGKQQLMAHFNGLEVFLGSGGFLGISSISNSTVVDRVTEGSAAHLAGIRSRDKILAINNIQVKTFEQLRAELGKYQAGDEVEIAIERFPSRLPGEEIQEEPLVVKAKLQEES